jgi:hypothetical protein
VKFELEQFIEMPADEAYLLLRDRLTDLVPYLPAIDEIETLERVFDDDGSLRTLYRWAGNRKLVPPLARPFVTRSMTSWNDRGHWPAGTRECHWVFEPERFGTLFTCRGTTHIEEGDAGTTRLRLVGDLEVYPDKIPGISEKRGKKLAPRITPWVISKIEPNMMQVPSALKSFAEGG